MAISWWLGTPTGTREEWALALAEEITRELAGSDWEAMSAQEALRWAAGRFGPTVRFAASFGLEDVAIIDMAVRAGIRPHVFYLDTDVLFSETYALIEQVRVRYGIEIDRVTGQLSLQQQALQHGEALWARDPTLCCAIRKVAPLVRYLEDKAAWVTGIRRDQSPVRAGARRVEWDGQFGLVKINPIVDWSSADVRRYVEANAVPHNPLHDQGYPSIGCRPCTRPVRPDEDERAGRWSGFEKTECGLHGQGD